MRARLVVIAASVFAIAAPIVVAQNAEPAAPKRMTATRILERPRIDGRLDDPAWATASFVGDFKQKDPIQGAAPSERTELAIGFDDDAIYVGARMFRRDPSRIHRAVTRRDDVGNTERIIVSLDTYHDHRTAYSFSVTAAGGIADYYHASDDEFDRDFSFNPVWEAETIIDDGGWTVEMRIPFSQLRFNDLEKQVWGINIDRWVPDLNEDIYWVMVPKDEHGWSSRFGELTGLDDIKPSVRFELLPYVAGEARLQDESDPRNPFDDRLGGRAGLDVKLGLGPNLTLDATINPDFGQVEADPALVNLSDFESTFDERRPFFVEGSQLLSGEGASYFYSRRIGAPPHGSARGDFVESPSSSTILAASKLTGRLPSGLSIGALTAVTERETARSYDLADRSYDTVDVEPLTAYGVIRMQQELDEGRTTLGAIGTVVGRAIDDGSTLGSILPTSALTGGIDYTRRFGGGAWELEGFIGGSHVRGDSLAITRLQRSSARYYGRPDADYVQIDQASTTLSGYTLNLNLSKTNGLWRGYVGGLAESPGFELNDIGQLNTADDIEAWMGASYHETEPGDILRDFNVSVSTNAGWNYGGVNTWHSFITAFGATLHSFWSLNGWLGVDLPRRTDGLSRGGPLMGTALNGFGGLGVSTPYTDKVRGWLNLEGSGNAIGAWSLSIYPGMSAQLGEQWALSFNPRFERFMTPRQYVATIDSGGARTYGRRYVFARIDQTFLSAQVRLSCVLTPRLSLDLYAEPFTGAGRYYDYGELPEPGSTDIRRYASSGGTVSRVDVATLAIDDDGQHFEVDSRDFTYLSFRSNVVLRWEWLPGSTAYFVWQRSAADLRPQAEPLRPRHIGDAIGAPGDQVFAIKVAYWLPVD